MLRTRTLTLAELAEVVGSMAAQLTRREDDRVRTAPDERTLRYYQSTGLLDRPLRYDGRVAIYGFRHVLQALAVKALQGHGYSLAQAQGSLAGATTEALEALVREAAGSTPVAVPPSVAPGGPPPDARLERSGWITVEVAPGVLVSMDLARVPDPTAALARIAAALAPPLSGEPS